MESSHNQEARYEYSRALRLGQREYSARSSRGERGNLPALDELTSQLRIVAYMKQPQREISLSRVVGTYTSARANSFAANHLIPAAQEEAMRQCRTEQSIKSFAKRIGIAPGIVVGRLQHDGQIRRNQFNHLKRRFQMEATNAG